MEKWQLDELNNMYEYTVLPALLEKAVVEMTVQEIKGLILRYRHNDPMMNILLDEMPKATMREKEIAHTTTAELTD